LEAAFVLLEFSSPSRRIFIGSHSLPPLWFAVSVLQTLEDYLSRPSRLLETILLDYKVLGGLSYGPPWAHYLGGYQDRLLGGPLGLPGLCHTAPDGVRRKDYGGEVLE
jgi:hypothetical protein